MEEQTLLQTKSRKLDVKEGACQTCGKYANLLSCKTCNYAYHPKCLMPVLRSSLPSSWKCPDFWSSQRTRENTRLREALSTLGSNQVFMKHYLVKWKRLSYIHCSRVPETEFIKAYKANPRLRTKVKNFHKQASLSDNAEDDVPIRPDRTTVDRIIACSFTYQLGSALLFFFIMTVKFYIRRLYISLLNANSSYGKYNGEAYVC